MIDLCAGTGAFTYAFEQTKLVEVVYANDQEETSKIIYDYNFNHKLTLGNICDINVKDIPSHNILSAGFPCQPFSIAGKQEGFNDNRSNVFWKIIEIIKFHKPECIILENVKNLTSHDNGNTFRTIKESLEKEKYHIIYKILNTSDITPIPQHRERIYIICVKNKNIFNEFNLNFKQVNKYPIKKMLEKNNIDNKYYYNNKENKIHELVNKCVINKKSVYQFRRIYVRENKNNECPTLTANMGTGGHNVPLIIDNLGARKLIPKECFNFQGFPKTYKLPKLSDNKLYKLAGNAVSVPVVILIANNLVPILYKSI
jgi:DNA (cytosine-5)-methyltransferase 1